MVSMIMARNPAAERGVARRLNPSLRRRRPRFPGEHNQPRARPPAAAECLNCAQNPLWCPL